MHLFGFTIGIFCTGNHCFVMVFTVRNAKQAANLLENNRLRRIGV
jgi:hypothetical protein